MFESRAVIRNDAGIHCRPSAILVKEGMAYSGSISVEASSGSCDLTSAMELLMLALEKGTEVLVRVEGPEEEAVGRHLVELFETKFDFPPQ